jgi:hypothetical protein
MRLYKKDAKPKNETDNEEKPTKSVCEKKERKSRKGPKNKVFWIPKEREMKPITMFTDALSLP